MTYSQGEMEKSDPPDRLDLYFECITACYGINGEDVACITTCIASHLDEDDDS